MHHYREGVSSEAGVTEGAASFAGQKCLRSLYLAHSIGLDGSGGEEKAKIYLVFKIFKSKTRRIRLSCSFTVGCWLAPKNSRTLVAADGRG